MLWGVQQKSATTRQFVTAWLLFWPTKRPCKPGTLWCNSLRSKMVMLRACQRNERLPNHRKNALKNKKSKRSLIRAWRRSFSILRFAFVYRRFFHSMMAPPHIYIYLPTIYMLQVQGSNIWPPKLALRPPSWLTREFSIKRLCLNWSVYLRSNPVAFCEALIQSLGTARTTADGIYAS